MAQPGSALSPAAEEKLDELLQMMKKLNAMLATWSSAPSSSSTSPASSTPTAAAAVATPPSTTASTVVSTPITATKLSAIDEYAVTSSAACCNRARAAPTSTSTEPTAAPTSRWTALLPVARSTTTTTLDAIDECAVKWSLDSKHIRVIPAAHPQAITPSTASSTVAVLDVHHGSSTPTTPTPPSVASTPIPKQKSPAAEDDAAVALPTRCSTDGFNRDTNMLMSGSSITTISTMLPSSAAHILTNQVSAPALGKFQYAHQVLQVTSTSSFPFLVNDGKCYDPVLLWPPPANYWIYCTASCVFDRGKSRERHLTIIGNRYWPSLQASALVSWLGVHLLTLQIELKPWPNWHGHQGSPIVTLVCSQSNTVIWVQFSCSMHKLLVWPLLCESWWECCADCLQLFASAGQVDPITMEAIGLSQMHIVISIREVYCLLFTCYHQLVEWKPPWISLVYNTIQRGYPLACSSSMWIPTRIHLFWWPAITICDLCVRLYKQFVRNAVGQCIYFRFIENHLVHILKSVMPSMLFSCSQYASLLLHSCRWCFGQLWKPPWPCQGHVLATCSESVVQVFFWPPPVHVYSVVTKKHLLVSVLRWQQKCDGTIRWNDYFLSDEDLIIIWSTTEERRPANCMRHGKCYYSVVWGGPIILVFVSAGHSLGGENSVMLQLSVVNSMILAPANYKSNRNGSIFYQWLVFVSISVVPQLPGCMACSSAGKLSVVWADSYVLLLSSKLRCCRQFWKPPWTSLLHCFISWKFPVWLSHLQSSITVVAVFLRLTGIKSVLPLPTLALDIIKNCVHYFGLDILHGYLIPQGTIVHMFWNHPSEGSRILLFGNITGGPQLMINICMKHIFIKISIWQVLLNEVPVLQPATTKFTVEKCSPNGVIFQCSYTRELFLIGTVHFGQLLSVIGHLLYSRVLLPLAASVLRAWCDNEDLDHDMIILPSFQVTISVGLQVHLMVFRLTDFHGNEADQSYFLSAWEAIYYSECASTFDLPTVPFIQFQAYSSQNSKTRDVMYKTLTNSSMLALQFYNLMVEDP